MGENMDYLKKPVLMHVCKDGTVTIRTRDEPVFNGKALPFYSTDTKERAETLRVLACKVQYREHPDLPGEPWFRLNDWDGNVDKIPQLALMFRDLEKAIEKRDTVTGVRFNE